MMLSIMRIVLTNELDHCNHENVEDPGKASEEVIPPPATEPAILPSTEQSKSSEHAGEGELQSSLKQS